MEHDNKAISTPNNGAITPLASTFTSSPLHNRIRIELKAPISEVWALIGDHARFPEYSSSLERVEVKKDSSGTCKEYVCHFKPQEEGGESVDDNPQVAARYGIRSIPTLLFFKDGQVVDQVIGVAPKKVLAAKLTLLLKAA